MNIFDDDQMNMFNKNSKPKKTKKPSLDEKAQRVIDTPKGEIYEKTVEEVMHSSMMPYSEFVIMDRALPRVEDGLKPVQRRILYTMLESGLTPDKPFRKCAKIVGDVLGRYHPHGDSSVYDALVRMAQDFTINVPLAEGHGNFGSIDGDKAAAYRYTEARLSNLALELMQDIDKDTVTYSLNFDDTLKEPDYFPGKFPNLFVNGASGIAVGLATNIPPHNLDEMLDAVVGYIDNPKATLQDMLKYVKGPDFPSGGIMSTGKDMLEAYETGKGKVTLRAKFHKEELSSGKINIVITELPYQVNKALFLQHVMEVKEKIKGELNNIVEITDESDKNGMRAVITIKKDGDYEGIIALLLKHTEMQQNFNMNMVAIVDGAPKQLGLLDYLKCYVDFQVQVICRRTQYDYDRAVARVHILEGLLIAIQNIDEVIAIIKSSVSTSHAKQRLMDRFALTEVQAVAILDMKLARLTNLETTKIQQEIADLHAKIEEYLKILSSRARQLSIVKKEMRELKKKYPTPRQTEVVEEHEAYVMTPIEQLVDTECLVAVSDDGLRLKNIVINAQLGSNTFDKYNSVNVLHHDILKTSTNATIYAFTNLGNMYKISVGDIPVVKFNGKGTNLSQIAKAEINERIVNIFEMDEFKEDGELIMFTQDGYIKRVDMSELLVNKPVVEALGLRDLDRLVGVQPDYKMPSVLMISKQGMAVNYEYETVPKQKRAGTGVIGMSLNDGDKVCFASQVNQTDKVLVIDCNSNAKRIVLNELSVGVRNRKGLKVVSTGEQVAYAVSPVVTGEVVVVDSKGNLATIDVNDIPVVNRISAGKPIVKNKALQKIKSAIIYIA